MKPWMVMVHGMSQDRRVFSSQVAAFTSDYRILPVDLPGHGRASDVGGPFGHVEFARHVELVLAAEGVNAAVYWGTHTGATIGLYLAATRPGLIGSLILEGPLVPGANAPVVAHSLGKAKATAREKGLGAAIEEWWFDSDWFAYMRAHPQACRAEEHMAIVRDFAGAPWLDDRSPEAITGIEDLLRGIDIPVLIYNGAADHPEFPSAANDIGGLLGNVQKATVPDSGGFPAWENPDAVNALVRDFLA